MISILFWPALIKQGIFIKLNKMYYIGIECQKWNIDI